MDDDMTKKEEMMSHLDEHIDYPATKEEIVKACDEMSDVPQEDKKWLEDNLPDKTYQSSDEVKEALGEMEN